MYGKQVLATGSTDSELPTDPRKRPPHENPAENPQLQETKETRAASSAPGAGGQDDSSDDDSDSGSSDSSRGVLVEHLVMVCASICLTLDNALAAIFLVAGDC